MKHELRSWLSATFLLLPFTTVADDHVIDEIVVTADYLQRPVNELPASVSLLGAEVIDDLAVQHFEELVNVVPNLNWSGDGHRARYFQIRGIGERSQYEGAPNPSVGFIVDDIDFSGIGTIATLFDVERVEVLRGPQAIRYGANALAGLIYVQSANPGSDRDGRLQLTVGGDRAFSVGAATRGNFGSQQQAAFRISGHYHESDGFRDNPFLGRSDTNGRQETAIRGKLNYAIRDNLDLAIALMYANIDNGYDAFALDNSLTVLSDDPGRDAQESLGASVRFEWLTNNDLRFTSITSAADSQIDFSFDADWGNEQSWLPYTYDFVSINDRKRNSLSQEFRLASDSTSTVNWLGGIYALRLSEDLTTLNLGDYVDPGFFACGCDSPPFFSAYEATSIAGFGQVVIPMSSLTDLDVGLRVERRSTDYADSNLVMASPSETMTGGHVSLTHIFSDQLNGFVGVSRGYKAGGFNLGEVPAGRRDFDSEVLWNLEAGIKGDWLDNRLSIAATLFYSDRDDQQVSTSFQPPGSTDPNEFVFFTDNATGSSSFGLEADLRWLPNESWEFYASIGLLETEFDEFVTSEVDNTGRELAHAPNYTLAAGAVWRGATGWFARADITARDAFFFSDSHDQRSESYSLTNLRIGYEGDTWRTDVWVRNLFDEYYAVRGFYFGNEPPNFPATLYTRAGDPRQVGVTIERSF